MQLLNTPIISMESFSELEDRNGLVVIDCGDEVRTPHRRRRRILIPMSTHPLWRQGGGGSISSSRVIPRMSSSVLEACLFQNRISWHHLSPPHSSSSFSSSSLLWTLLCHGAWAFAMLALIYPYLVIIFISFSQLVLFRGYYVNFKESSSSVDESSNGASSTLSLLVACLLVVMWSNSKRFPSSSSSSAAAAAARRMRRRS